MCYENEIFHQIILFHLDGNPRETGMTEEMIKKIRIYRHTFVSNYQIKSLKVNPKN